ncbi:hypothetical protein FQR65_LT03326 [Abscondita terminalis]|nr:hypothetical protein FQR65_LT03326 [Abscondita terminalis]
MKIIVYWITLTFLKYGLARLLVSTFQEVPLHLRNSWVNVTEQYHTQCVCESGVNAFAAINSLAITQLSNDPHLKCYYKCLDINLLLLDPVTGSFVKSEFLRYAGITSEIFDKCSGQTESMKDLCAKSFYMYLCVVHSVIEPKQ